MVGHAQAGTLGHLAKATVDFSAANNGLNSTSPLKECKLQIKSSSAGLPNNYSIWVTKV